MRDNNERKKHTCHTKLCAFRRLISRPRNLILRSRNQIHRKVLLPQKLITSEGAVSHNVFYYQQLSIARYQVTFYANNYFEELPIVSTAFNMNVSLYMHVLIRDS